jgi:hypothetical protein
LQTPGFAIESVGGTGVPSRRISSRALRLRDFEISSNIKAVTGFTGVALVLLSSSTLASGNPLLGTWKLKSHVATTAAGQTSTLYGEHPTGYLSYSADGRMQAIGTADGRIAPPGAAPTDEEQVMLHKTMFAYAGTYTVESDKVIHHVDISWNQVWNGTDQVRFYKVTGNTLIITASVMDPASSTETHFVVVWEKVGGPR